MRHVLSVKNLTPAYVEEIIREERKMREFRTMDRLPRDLGISETAKATILMLEPSTRTGDSFGEAARLLGFYVRHISGTDTNSLAKGESYANTVRTFGKRNQGADLLVMRTKIMGAARFAAEILEQEGDDTAVINGGDGFDEHVTQALMDFVQIYESKGRTCHFIMGLVGDLEMSRVAHSVLEMARLMGVKKIRLVSAPESRVQEKYKRGFEEVLEGESLELLKDCDVVMALRTQAERYQDQLKLQRVRGHRMITLAVLDSWKVDVSVMHPQPNIAEIIHLIYYDPRVVMRQQSEKGPSTRMAVCLKSYLHRKDITQQLTQEFNGMRIKGSWPIAERLASRQARGKGEGEFYRPIKKGTILDHIPCGQGGALLNTLTTMEPRAEEGVVHLIKGVPPISPKQSPKKDVIVLEGYFPGQAFWAAVAGIWPGVTVNMINEPGNPDHQVKFGFDPPREVVGAYRCPVPDCITNHDPEAATRTRFLVSEQKGRRVFECHYCEQEFSEEEIRGQLARR